ncbi:hypothetical protein C8Q79DRAFT_925039 [Trametes meyenii]|nr:hypothetical protein C8Q79DRAFT_925039 [Trametes meyenii]
MFGDCSRTLQVALIVSYDYLSTLDREVRLVRGRKLTWAKAIFLLNRYWAVVFFLLNFVLMVVHMGDKQSCLKLTYAWEVGKVIGPLVSVAFSGTRIYAISYQNATITSVVVLLGMGPVIADIIVGIILKGLKPL